MVNLETGIDCSECEEVSALVDGEARAAELVERHLASCERCAAFRRFTLRLHRELRESAAEASPAVWRRLLDVLPRPVEPALPWWSWPSLEFAPVAALALALLLAVAEVSPRLGALAPSVRSLESIQQML
jgi:anti-sigma factor RsiW